MEWIQKRDNSTRLIIIILIISAFSLFSIYAIASIYENSEGDYSNDEAYLDQDNVGMPTIYDGLNDTSVPKLPDVTEQVNLTDKALAEVLERAVLDKIHIDAENFHLRDEKEVIIRLKAKDMALKDSIKSRIDPERIKQSRDNGLIYARVNYTELSELANDGNVDSVWPDLNTTAFLNASTSQVSAQYLWDMRLSGKDVKIAVLDTGIDASHEIFSSRQIVSVDFTGDGENDSYGHGTHVAGIAAGNGYYKGIAYDATIYNVKVLDDNGYGQLSWLIDGIDWAIEQDVDVISLSLGALYMVSPEEQLGSPEVLKVEEAIANGITVVIASGNCGSGYCGWFSGVTTPGIARNAITVGAVDSSDEWAEFSSGDQIDDYIKPDVVAPGVSVCSSVPGGYDFYSGTSMATPFVSGAVALIIENDSSLSPIQVRHMLEDSAVDLGDVGKDVSYGAGRVDLSAVLGIEAALEEKKSYEFLAHGLEVGKTGDITLRYYNNESSAVRLRVEFLIRDIDGEILESMEQSVPPSQSRDFSDSWQPKVAGKYEIAVRIFEVSGEDEVLIEDFNEMLYVSGVQGSTISPVRLVLGW